VAGGLLTDLYELNMAASYLRRGMNGLATLSLFVRRLPADRGLLVAAGLEDCLQFLEGFSLTAEDLGYLRHAQRYDEDVLRMLAGLRFTGDVRAVPEGRVVFAGEPLLEVTAPVAEAQLAETVLLNHLTFQTSVATKAARCVLAAAGAGGRFRVPAYPGDRGRSGCCPRLIDRWLRIDQQHRGGQAVWPDCRGHDGALLHRGIRQ